MIYVYNLFYIKKVKIIIIVINNKNIITNIIHLISIIITFAITNAILAQYMLNNYTIKYILHYSNKNVSVTIWSHMYLIVMKG